MKRYALPIGITLATVLTLLSGVIQGRMSNRWGPPPDMLAAAEKLEEIPSRFGNWELEASDKLAPSVEAMLECTGYVFRTYVNQETGETVRVAILVGPSGPMSVHTPEICFSSRDYTTLTERSRLSISNDGSPKENFWGLTFRANNLESDVLRVCYGWSTGRRWTAPEDPRFEYAAYPFLYKIQLAASLPPHADLEVRDPCQEFLKDFSPVLQPHLVEAK